MDTTSLLQALESMKNLPMEEFDRVKGFAETLTDDERSELASELGKINTEMDSIEAEGEEALKDIQLFVMAWEGTVAKVRRETRQQQEKEEAEKYLDSILN